MTSQYLTTDIQRDEGCKLTAYPDPLSGGDPWTVGFGQTGPGIGPGTVWTQAQADEALCTRISQLINQLASALPWWPHLSDLRQDCLVNMAYNMGLNGLLAFHNTLAAIEAQNWQAAHDGMLASKWADQVPNRANRLAQQMLTGEHV